MVEKLRIDKTIRLESLLYRNMLIGKRKDGNKDDGSDMEEPENNSEYNFDSNEKS